MGEAPQESEPCWTCGGDWDECQHDNYHADDCAWCGQPVEDAIAHEPLPGEDENGVRECEHVAPDRIGR